MPEATAPPPSGEVLVGRQETVLSTPRREDSRENQPLAPSAHPHLQQLFPGSAPQVQEDVAGLRIGHFVIEQRIGAGGMGTVFRAFDEQLQRIVALKVLSPQQTSDTLTVQRFRNEARAAAQLDHEHVARVFSYGEDRGLHYIAYEFVEGINLRELIRRRGRLTPAEVVRYGLQLTSALHHVARKNVVHRDIKPSNIIITPEGRAKLVDLGLARKSNPEESAQLTVAGTTLGTFDYISPEQARDPHQADVRSDIYSLGCTLYHALTGELPYPEGNVLQRLLNHKDKQPPDPARKNPQVPASLSAVIRKMMAYDPGKRYQRTEDLWDALWAVAEEMGLHQVLAGMAPLPGWIQGERQRRQELMLWSLALLILLMVVVIITLQPDLVERWNYPTSESSRPLARAAPTASTKAPPTSSSSKSQTPSTSSSTASAEDQPERAGNFIIPQPLRLPGVESPATDMAPLFPILSQGPPRSLFDDPQLTVTIPAEASGAATMGTGHSKGGGQEVGSAPTTPSAGHRDPLLTTAIDTPLTSGSERVPASPRQHDSTTNKSTPSTGTASTADLRPNPTRTGNPVSENLSEDSSRGRPERPSTTAEESVYTSAPFVIAGNGKGYDTLDAACADIRDQGTIELHFDGRLPQPQRPLRLLNKRLNVIAAAGKRPVLWFAPREGVVDAAQTRMITTVGGSLSLNNIELELRLPEFSAADTWAVISAMRPDRVRLQGVVVTLINPRQHPASVIEIAPASGESVVKMGAMKEGQAVVPVEILLERCLWRGEGNGVRHRDQFPLRLEAEQSLFALSEWFMVYDPSQLISTMPKVRLSLLLNQTTCLLGHGLYHGAVREEIAFDPPELEIVARGNIFSTRNQEPLLLQLAQSLAREERRLLSWSGENNHFDHLQQLWVVQAPGMMQLEQRDFESWRGFWPAEAQSSRNDPIPWLRDWRQRPWNEILPDDVQRAADPATRSFSLTVEAGVAIEHLPRPRHESSTSP
ncbi:MAG: hypothetical protein KatS3mg113_0212 [Planctomycetaceae bacterium]|nr:MAG: hypothetical protein KatS3mg113_0212 [Planctomycetaceae bacterium]